MKGKHHGGYLMEGDRPYKRIEEAQDRIRRIKRDYPDMRSDDSRVAGENTWYYEIVPYRNGYAVLSSYTKSYER